MLPAPGSARQTVRPDLCPFKDRLCRELRCPTCSPGASDLTAAERRYRLLRLAENPAWPDQDRALFRAAAEDLLPVATGELVHVPGARRVVAPATAPLDELPPFVARVLGEEPCRP